MTNETSAQSARAARTQQTRDRILQATMDLHREVGPAATTISAIAERAGVQRLTVYRHFPDEESLLQACNAKVMEERRPPDPSAWLQVADPVARLERALLDVYRFYDGDPEMLRNILRDAQEMDALARIVQPMQAYFDRIRALLVASLPCDPSRAFLCEACVGHALDFRTWSSLRERGLSDAEAARVMRRFVMEVGVADESTV